MLAISPHLNIDSIPENCFWIVMIPLCFIEHFDFIWLKMFTSSQQRLRFLLAVTVSYRWFISVAQITFRIFVFSSKILDANVVAEGRPLVRFDADSVA